MKLDKLQALSDFLTQYSADDYLYHHSFCHSGPLSLRLCKLPETGQGRQIRFEYGTAEEARPLQRVLGNKESGLLTITKIRWIRVKPMIRLLGGFLEDFAHMEDKSEAET